jgi:DNA gyrase subunit A
MLMTSSGMLVRTTAASVSRLGRNTQGVRVVRLRDGDRLIDCATTPGAEGDDETTPAAEPAAPEGNA